MMARWMYLCIVLFFLCAVQSRPVQALPNDVISDLQRYAGFWKQKAKEADAQLKRDFPDGMPGRGDAKYDKYVALYRVKYDGEQKSKTYLEASRTKDGMLTVITETAVNSMADMMEMGKIMLSKEFVKNIFEKNWTDILKSAYDAMFRQKIRKVIRETLGCAESVKGLEDDCMEMVTPKVEKSKIWQKFEKEADNGVNGLKKVYENEIKKQFTKEWLKKTKGMGRDVIDRMAEKYSKKAMDQASAAIDAAKFTIDVAQKVYFWNEFAPTISQTVEAVAMRRNQYREHNQDISCEDAYLVWAGKKQIPLANVDTGTGQPPQGGIDTVDTAIAPSGSNTGDVDTTSPADSGGDAAGGGDNPSGSGGGSGSGGTSSGGGASSSGGASSTGGASSSGGASDGSGDSGSTANSDAAKKAFKNFIEAKERFERLPPGKEKDEAENEMNVNFAIYQHILKGGKWEQ